MRIRGGKICWKFSSLSRLFIRKENLLVWYIYTYTYTRRYDGKLQRLRLLVFPLSSVVRTFNNHMTCFPLNEINPYFSLTGNTHTSSCIFFLAFSLRLPSRFRLPFIYTYVYDVRSCVLLDILDRFYFSTPTAFLRCFLNVEREMCTKWEI